MVIVSLPDMRMKYWWRPVLKKVEEFWMSMFFASGKYLLDILYGLEFSRKYQDNLVLNQKYEKAGEKSLWGLNEES